MNVWFNQYLKYIEIDIVDIMTRFKNIVLLGQHIRLKLTKFSIILIGMDALLLVLIGGYFIIHAQNNCLNEAASLAKTKVLAPCIQTEVLPPTGFKSKIVLGDIILKMEQDGIIDKSKVEALYKQQGGLTKDELTMLSSPTTQPLTINTQNEVWLVNMLWGIGLGNYMNVNKQSPIYQSDVNGFASTGGWTLGKSDNGGDYFNKYNLISLSPTQQERVKQLAETIYRPCCNNPTFFPDCNHGAAAMALIELGVSEGLSDNDIYKTVLGFNSFWFPNNYLETALYFNRVKHTDWNNIDPKVVLSSSYSSISGWIQNVDTPLQKEKIFIPSQSAGSCGV